MKKIASVLRLVVCALALCATCAQASLLDFLNGVSLGKKPAIPELTYFAAKPQTDKPLTLWYFWATWCGPCRDSMPLLNRWLKQYPDMEIVAVTDEESDKVQAFTAKVAMDMPIALDTQRQLFKSLGIRGLPYAMMLDAHGAVVWRGQPKELGADELAALLKAAATAKCAATKSPETAPRPASCANS